MSAFLVSALLVASASAQTFETQVLRDHGPSANRVNLVVLGDGYTAGEMTKLHDDAVAVLDALFAIEPYADYQRYFRATLVYVVSNESGADHPEGPTPTFRDTAFGAYYECAPGVTDVLCADTGAALNVATAHVPEFHLVVLVVNDDAAGGSGGSVLVTSRNVTGHPLLPARLAHELGHGLGSLADEYQTPYPSYPPCSSLADCPEPNVTLRTSLASIKWNHWMDEVVPLPTPAVAQYADVIGLFEGARYLDADIYRPAMTCRMRDVGAEFCVVCQEALVKAIYERVSPLDAQAPGPSLDLLIGEERTLSVARLRNESATVGVTWRIDGVVQAAATGDELLVRAAELGGGSHTVTAEVRDLTPRVRNDSGGLLGATASWTVGVTGCGDGIVQAGEQCDGDPACSDRCEVVEAPAKGCGCGVGGASPLFGLLALAGLVRGRSRPACASRE
jgi:MYXO-CTERM domain-containing protein